MRRRAARMARPARVRIRRRKPCVLARRRLFGWKVRLLTSVLRRLRARSDGVGSHPRVDGADRWRPQSASPWRPLTGRTRRGTELRGHGHAKEVAGHARSTIREAVKKGQTGAPTAEFPPKRPMIQPHLSHSPRHAVGARAFLSFRLCSPPWLVRFSTIRGSRATLCTACGQLCGHKGFAQGARSGARVRDR